MAKVVIDKNVLYRGLQLFELKFLFMSSILSHGHVRSRFHLFILCHRDPQLGYNWLNFDHNWGYNWLKTKYLEILYHPVNVHSSLHLLTFHLHFSNYLIGPKSGDFHPRMSCFIKYSVQWVQPVPNVCVYIYIYIYIYTSTLALLLA